MKKILEDFNAKHGPDLTAEVIMTISKIIADLPSASIDQGDLMFALGLERAKYIAIQPETKRIVAEIRGRIASLKSDCKGCNNGEDYCTCPLKLR